MRMNCAPFFVAPPGRLSYEVDARTSRKRRHAAHCELDVIGTPVEPFHRVGVARHDSALARDRLLRQIVERAHSHPETLKSFVRPQPQSLK